MNPIVAIPVIALIIASLGVTIVSLIQQQNNSADTSMQISELQNNRVRENVEFSLDANNNIVIQNKWSDATKILQIRILDDDGKIIKSWATNQDIAVGKTDQLTLNDEVLQYLDSFQTTP